MASHSLNEPLPFKLTGAEFCRNPHETFAAMRAEGEVIPLKLPIIGSLWVTTTYAATEAVLKDNALFVLEGRNAGKTGVAGMKWWMPKALRRLTNNMLAKDEPDHSRLRKLVDQAFTRHNIQAMRGDIEDRADRLLGDMSGETDLVSAYARKLPMEVICDLLGLPEKDYPFFTKWATAIAGVNSVWGILRFVPALRQLTRYLQGQIEEVRQEPRKGIIGELILAEEDGDRLSADELVSMIFLLLVAGFETTTNLISGAVFDLETHPEQKAWFLEDLNGRMERAVEELGRHVSSIQGTKPRYVARDTEFFGERLSRGDIVMALPAAANADPAIFDEPDELRLNRFPNPHLVFSTGVHFCLGQQLARVETQSALKCLYSQYPNLQLVSNEPDYANRIGHRALSTLRVRLNDR